MAVDLLTLEDRLTRLENRTKSNFFEIEKRFADLSEKGEGGSQERMQEIEDLLMLIQLENTKMKESMGSQEAVPSVETADRISRMEAALEELRPQGTSGLPKEALGEINSKFDKLEAEIASVKQSSGNISPKDVDGSVAKVSAARLDLENSISRFNSLKKDIETGLEEKRDMISKFDRVEVDVEKASAYFTKMKTIEEKINAIASKAESINDGMDSRMKNESERMELIKRDIENSLAATEDKFKSRLEKLDAVMESADVKSQDISRKMGELQDISRDFTDVASVKAAIDEQTLRIASLERNISAIGKSVSEVRGIRKEMEEELSIRGSLEKKLNDISYNISLLGDMNSRLEDESAARAALESRLQDLSSELADMRRMKAEIDSAVKTEIIEELGGALHIDEIRSISSEIAEHRKVIQNLKADLEIAAARFFTNNLEEFARALDKKFPGFVSREEYARSLQEISQRLKTIEAPDLSPLSARVEMAERKLEDVHAMMQSLANTMPIVVE